MRADVLIVGQGLAGSVLGWELERAGVRFAMADPGHAAAATRAAAGIINPITGRRLVKSWRVDTLLPQAQGVYGAMAAALGVPLWRELRIRRLFADERERQVAAAKLAEGALAPYGADPDDDGFWIRGAGRVDLAAMLAALRGHWAANGWLREEAVDPLRACEDYELVIDCRGQAMAEAEAFSFVPWEFSKGEVLEVAVEGLEPDVVINRRNWVLPVTGELAWAGATHEPGVRDAQPTAAACAGLAERTQRLLGRPFRVVGQRAGVRVNLPDKRPVAGRHPARPRLGVMGALGAKGALFAPFLAREWAMHLTRGGNFDPEIDVRRFTATPAVRA